jgi:hypothetical protein
MKHGPTRREFLATSAAALATFPGMLPPARSADPGQAVETLTLTAGDLRVQFRDNAHSPKQLSGVASLVNHQDAPGFDAIDPQGGGASGGLNFEHVISGHKDPHNAFTPRHGPYPLLPGADGRSATLVRKPEDDPWALASTCKYTLAPPHALDLEFRCVPHDPARFGRRGHALLFFANYLNDVEDVALHFRGVEGPGQAERWVRADAPPGPPDWNQGGTYRSVAAEDLAYDADHNFPLNSWSYPWPRFTRPFYFGKAAHGMVFLLMFDKMFTEEDEIRYSLFKFKVPRAPRPAWDFQYVLRKMQAGHAYGFKARLVWKKFVSPDDCWQEYTTWAASMGGKG